MSLTETYPTKEMKQAVQQSRQALEEVRMSKAFLDDKINFISFSLLKDVPLYIRQPIAEKVYTTLIKKEERKLTFYVEFEPKGTLAKHSHDCYEFWKIIRGYEESGLTEGIIQPMKPHTFKCPIETTMIVEFYI